jgi:predicted ATP-grasp superfamily ATP-dependent carboligase
LELRPRIDSLLVVGLDLTAIAASARRAGYKVYSVDFFGDVDLRLLCEESLSIIRQQVGKSCGLVARDFNVDLLLQLVKTLLQRRGVDGVVFGSGVEDAPLALEEIHGMAPVIGNTPEVLARVRNPITFFQGLHQLGVSYPQTAVIHTFDEARTHAKDLGYPVVLKPGTGFGGVEVQWIAGEEALEEAFDTAIAKSSGYLVQEYIPGVPASVSLLSTSEDVATLSVNEQLLGVRRLGMWRPFGYCGNIVPLSSSMQVLKTCSTVAEKIVSHFGLVGSNGIDVVVSREGTPFVIEVNPRFQGTLECVERVCGVNMVKAHVEACVDRRLLRKTTASRGCCTRLILYSPRRVVVPDLRAFGEVRDIPLIGAVVEEGEPVCSIAAEGATQEASLRKGWRVMEAIFNTFCPHYLQ